MKMLQTNLPEIETREQLNNLLDGHENVMLCCGRMGSMCVPVYQAMSEIENDWPDVKFAVMGFNNPDAEAIIKAPECSGFMGIPFTIYYKNGKIVKATSSLQTKEQITEILDVYFKN